MRPLKILKLWAIFNSLLFIISCQKPEAVDAMPLHEKIITARPWIVVPSFRWEEAKNHRWVFRAEGEILFWFSQVPSYPLRLFLKPDPQCASFFWKFELDGKPLFTKPLALPKQGMGITLPFHRLQFGTHALKIIRHYTEVDYQSVDNVFYPLQIYGGGIFVTLMPQQRETYLYIADLLRFGVTGMGHEKRDGWIFLGSGEKALSLKLTRDAIFHACLENPSSAPGSLTLTLHKKKRSYLLAPKGKKTLTFKLAKGRHHLKISLQGKEGGFYFVSRPHLLQKRNQFPIFLITLDTTRRDMFAPYGNRENITPHLNAFAKTATVFTQAYATAPWTLPSHASLFTGLYPSYHGAGVRDGSLRMDIKTLSQLLRKKGYITFGFAGGDLCHHRFGISKGFDYYRDPDNFETKGDQLTHYVQEVLEPYKDDTIFVFINYFDPHALYIPPEAYRKKFHLSDLVKKIEKRPIWGNLVKGSLGAWEALTAGKGVLDLDGLAYLRAAYKGEVAFVDAMVGELLRTLKAWNLFDPSLIIITADHGELLGEGGFLSHSVRLDIPLVHVPLFIKYPYQKKGVINEQLFSLKDIFPLVLQGSSFLPPRKRLIFMEEHAHRIHPLIPYMKIDDHLYGIQMRDRRWVLWQKGFYEENLASFHWEKAPPSRSWEAVLRILQKDIPVVFSKVHHVGVVSEEEHRRLKALGYLQ